MIKNITMVLCSNMINMLVSVAIGFILPKYLTLESYGYYKLFQFYINYAGLLHLGYADGIFLRYGGMTINQITKENILTNSCTLRNMQLIISAIILAGGIYIKNYIIILLACSLMPINMIAYYKNIFQATGEFKKYGYIISVLPMLNFIGDFILLKIIMTDNYVYYIFVTVISNLLVFMTLEIYCIKVFGGIKLSILDIKNLVLNIKTGISLLLGNLASVLIVSIDRWCIQIFLTLKDFSYYSFAVSIENLFNICVSAITIAFYSYLCKEKNVLNIKKMKTSCIIISIYLISISFPVKLIIQIWLNKYENSIVSLFFLIAAHAFYFVIKAIYVNLYKANHEQKYYFYQMLFILGIAVITDLLAYYFISKTIEIFAIATLCTAMVWYIICFFRNQDIKSKLAENLLIFFSVGTYLFCGILIPNAVIGGLVYLCIITISVFITYRNYEYNVLSGLLSVIKT